MTTFPLPTLAPSVTSLGISAPTYPDILQSVTVSMQSIYGSDIVVDASSQDGEWLAILAAAQNDTNNSCIATYNSFSPSTGQGQALSSNVKLNGLRRLVPTNSQAPATVAGTVGTIINNGLVGDNLGLNTQWALPAQVVIPSAGSIIVTATCTEEGSTQAAAGTLTQILTPTRGWLTVTNADDASPGAPVEDDATLRRRQASSTELSAISLFEGCLAAIRNLTGVTRAWGYNNATNATVGSIPAHAMNMVVEGGDTDAIANTIYIKKSPGAPTFGGTTINVVDQYGNINPIEFDVLAYTRIYLDITVTDIGGYISTTGDAIKAALAAAVSNPINLNNQGVGETVYYNKLWSPANLSGSVAQRATGLTQTQLDLLSQTYDITALTIGTAPTPVGVIDIAIDYNKSAALAILDIALTVV